MKKKRRDFSRFFRTVFFLAVAGSVAALLGLGGIVLYFSQGLPKIITVADYRPKVVTRLYADEGHDQKPLAEFYKERRYVIPFEKIPERVVQAFIAVEDDRFYEHPGINIASIIRAGIANFRAGHIVQGGSTITQQVAKSLLLTSERSIDRKIKEVILASRIERNLSKDQILFLYLNQIYLGHGAYGVQAASRAYFRKDVSDINLAEAAILAGMPQAPGKFSPHLNPRRAKSRQLHVLRRMFENRFISKDEMEEAGRQPLRVYTKVQEQIEEASYFVEHVRRYLVERYGEQKVYEDGLDVYVTVTRSLAEASRKSIQLGLKELDQRRGFRGAIQNIKGSDEQQDFLKDTHKKMVEEKVPFKMFLADGRMSQKEALYDAGVERPLDMLQVDKLYQALVVGFDRKNKKALIRVGEIEGEITLAQMEWAKPPVDPHNRWIPRPSPKAPWSILKEGDVVYVSYLPKETKESLLISGQSSDGSIQFALDQKPNAQAALFSMDVRSGNVLAVEGGYRFEESEFNRATQAMRQPGSVFKPIIYAAALEKGYTPASIIVDSPIVFKEEGDEIAWKPTNYGNRFYGDTTFRAALIKSRNIPTVKLVQDIQVPFIIQFAKRIGLTSAEFAPDLSISLGSATTTLTELTRSFALFPRLGRKLDPVFVTKVTDRDGAVLEEHPPAEFPDIPPFLTNSDRNPYEALRAAAEIQNSLENPSTPGSELDPITGEVETANEPKEHLQALLKNEVEAKRKAVFFPEYPLSSDPNQVLDPRVAYVMTHLMTEVVSYGTGRQAKRLGRPAAGKTGTTNDSLDAWFIGFTPDLVTGVWVGFDDQKSLGPGETGGKTALPIWLSFMEEGVKNYPVSDFVVPPGVTFSLINPKDGRLAKNESRTAIQEAFIEGTEPQEGNASIEDPAETQGDFFKADRE